MRSAVFALLTILAPLAPAQDPGATVYKVEFNIHDGTDAAAKAGRRYTLLIDSSGKGTFKVGSRVPYASGSFQPGTGGAGINPLVNTQFTYIDVGVNIDCFVRPDNGKVMLHADLDLSTVQPPDKNAPAALQMNPIVSQLKISTNTRLDPGKPAPVATIDDPVTQRKFDIEATVTRIN